MPLYFYQTFTKLLGGLNFIDWAWLSVGWVRKPLRLEEQNKPWAEVTHFLCGAFPSSAKLSFSGWKLSPLDWVLGSLYLYLYYYLPLPHTHTPLLPRVPPFTDCPHAHPHQEAWVISLLREARSALSYSHSTPTNTVVLTHFHTWTTLSHILGSRAEKVCYATLSPGAGREW